MYLIATVTIIVRTTIVDMDLYFQTIVKIVRTGHWVTDRISQELKEFDATEPQFNVLWILRSRRGEPITVKEIQEKMVQRSSNVTRLIDKLLSKGMVERKECAANRRKLDITITQKGIDFLEKLERKVEHFHQSMRNNLDEKELKQLLKLINKLKGQ